MELIKIADIKPASYNPRKLTEEAFVELKGSIGSLGFILPIIVNRDNKTIVAGHQRTKVAKALGIDEVPCYFIGGVDLHDEIKFNQVHNGVEYEPTVRGTCDLDLLGFHTAIDNSHFICPDKNATIVAEISRLIIKYKDPLCAIICDGQVLFGNNYVYAAIAMDMPINCSFIDKKYREVFDFYFSKKYGVFNYEAIERNDFVQGLAQPNRHLSIDWSVLYKEIVPYLQREPKDISILDFGCGKGEFIHKVKAEFGIKKAIGLEFFNHNKVGISVERGHKLIDALIAHVKQYGAFDYVVCDAVINSVNTNEAEFAVMACLNLFCKDGGKVFFSGRRREDADNQINMKQHKGQECFVRFFDENGLTSILREGQWFFQKFLLKHQVDELTERVGLSKFMQYDAQGYFGRGCTKVKRLDIADYVKAVNYEFNLSLPNGKKYNRHEEVKELFTILLKGENDEKK